MFGLRRAYFVRNLHIVITYKISPQGLHYFEAEVDHGRWYHVSREMRADPFDSVRDAYDWIQSLHALTSVEYRN